MGFFLFTVKPPAGQDLFEKRSRHPQKLLIIKSFLGVQMLHGRFFKKAPWPPEARTLVQLCQPRLRPKGPSKVSFDQRLNRYHDSPIHELFFFQDG